MGYTTEPRYICNACDSVIQPLQPRVHCGECNDYDLCAMCALGERFTEPHLGSHRVEVLKESGDGVDRCSVPALLVSLSYKLPVPESVESPSLAEPVGSPASSESPVPPVPPAPVNLPPRLPPRPPARRTDTSGRAVSPSTSNPGAIPDAWDRFFSDDGFPTPVFISMMNAIFDFLDISRRGLLLPEAYSKFLDDQGYSGSENTWKSKLTPNTVFGWTKEEVADQALRHLYDLFSIEHMLEPRPKARNSQPPPSLAQQFQSMLGTPLQSSALTLTDPSSKPGPMPLLTRKGFIDITTLEVLSDPSRHWGGLGRLLRKYDLAALREWGDLPRSVLPEMPDEGVLKRIRDVSDFAQRKAEREMEEAQVRYRLEAKGRRNAEELTGNYVYEYRPV